MADYFYDGMPNVNERLNQLYNVFAAGPYNALPLTGGMVTGPVVSTSSIGAQQLNAHELLIAGDTAGPAWSGMHAPKTGLLAGAEYEVMRIGVGASSGVNYAGCWVFTASAAAAAASNVNRQGYKLALKNFDQGSGTFSGELFSVDGTGAVQIPLLKVNSNDTLPYHVLLARSQAEGSLAFSLVGSADFHLGYGSYGNVAQGACLRLTANAVTGRSLNAGGTLNASGADYAEYMLKSASCGPVAAGQIIGIDASGMLTDQWQDAISFAAKSTDPCIVGGDKWALGLGKRPGDAERTGKMSDAQWKAIKASVEAAQSAFDAALEAARQKVDRIAFAGQVPVNVLGAMPGQYIVPIRDGSGIAGMAMNEADMTLAQYMRAIGKVIAIENDGRARMIVKVA